MSEILNKIEILVKQHYSELSADKANQEMGQIRLSEPFYDSREAMNAIRTILDGWISQGPNVRKFERQFSQYIGTDHGIAVNSGSSANLLALSALKKRYDIPDGAEVIVPAATFATVSMPIIQVGLIPVYVDVCRDTLNMDPIQAEAAVSDKTRILMPVHTLGYPAPMNELIQIAEKNNLKVLEDCCEAHGSRVGDRKVGSFGQIASFSFFVAHNMTTGEGGMIVTGDDQLDDICRSLREFGRCSKKDLSKGRYYSDNVLKDYDKRYVFSQIGYNLRMTDVTGSFGLAQLEKLNTMNERRRENADWFQSALQEQCRDTFEFQGGNENYFHTYYTFPILLTDKAKFKRREFCENLELHNIETRPLFAGDQPAFRGQPGRTYGNLPVSRYIRDNLVFVGIHPGLQKHHIQFIADTIISFVNQ